MNHLFVCCIDGERSFSSSTWIIQSMNLMSSQIICMRFVCSDVNLVNWPFVEVPYQYC